MEQLRLSTLSGATEKIKNSTALNGVRDSSTAMVLNRVVEMGKILRKPRPGTPVKSELEIRAILEKELEEQMKKQTINPLIGMPGIF